MGKIVFVSLSYFDSVYADSGVNNGIKLSLHVVYKSRDLMMGKLSCESSLSSIPMSYLFYFS